MNYKRLSNLLLLFMLMGILFSTAASAATLGEILSSAGETILDVASLSYFADDLEMKITALIRIAMFVLIFTIIFAATGTLSHLLSRNMSIVVSLIISLIASIFIPNPILLAIGAALGATFAFLIFGALLVPAGMFFFLVPTESRGMAALKLGVLVLVSYIVAQVNSAALELTGGSFGGEIYNLGEFGQWINDLVTYAYLILAVYGAYLVYKLIKPTPGTGEWSSRLGDKLKEPFSRLGGAYEKGGLKGVGAQTKEDVKSLWRGKRAASREKTKLLNEYVEEKKESELLDDALGRAEDFDSRAKGFTGGSVNLTDLRN